MAGNRRDPSNFTQKLKREVARLHGDEYERPNGNITDYGDSDKYNQVREADRDAIDIFHMSIEDSAQTNQANHLLHLRQISNALDGPILEQSADQLNAALRQMEREREWSTNPPGSRRNHANSLAYFLRDHGQEAKADEIIIPSVTTDDYEVDPDTIPNWRENILPMIEEEPKARNKALIACAWESASRVTALAAYQIKHYEHKGDSAAILKTPDVIGTKGAKNNVKPLIIARPYIDHWLANSHPCPDDPEAALFCSIRSNNSDGESIHPRTIRDRVIKPAANRVEIDPDIRMSPHAMKHSRATYLRRHPDFDKTDIEHIMDWVENTEQHKRYIHTDNEQNANTILEKQGVDLGDDSGTEPLHTNCPRCGTTIPDGAGYCLNCGQKLDDKPADWYQYYRDIVEDTDPLRQKYDNVAGTTPHIQQLPRSEFEHAHKKLQWAWRIYRDEEISKTDYHIPDEKRDEVDVSSLDNDDWEYIGDNWITTTEPLADNYRNNPTQYDIEGGVDGLKPDEIAAEAERHFDNDNE